MRNFARRTALLLACWPAIAVAAPAEEPSSEAFFERQIVPIFGKRCVNCHNGSDLSGELDLTNGTKALAGGESGTTIVPGDAAESYLVEMVAQGKMPPKGKGTPLSAAEVATLTSWVKAGAVWPQGRKISEYEFSTDKRAGRDWWSLEPLGKPPVPTVKAADWVRNPIDAFILQKLEEKQLTPSAPASRGTNIRRVYLDLIGLAPTPEETRQFLADQSPDGYDKLVERLLASPRYGERWARHWLDVVRFAETNGFETNVPRPNAWHYRDYVIGAFNSDKPFNQFILDQLAGDTTGEDAATGFLVGGPFDLVKSPDINLTLMQRQDELADMVNTTGTTFLGLTVGCARCHNHKFDPILQQDFYAMQAVFAGVNHGDRRIAPPPNADQTGVAAVKARIEKIEADLAATGVKPPVSPTHNIERFAPVEARFIRFTVLATNSGSEPCLDELEVFSTARSGQLAQNLALAKLGVKASSSGDYANNPSHQLAHINDGQYGNGRSWISSRAGQGWVQLELSAPASIDRIEWSRDRQQQYTDRLPTAYRIEVALEPNDWKLVASDATRLTAAGSLPNTDSASVLPSEKVRQADRLNRDLRAAQAELKKLLESSANMAYAGVFGTPPQIHRLHRGDPLAPREPVEPGTLSLLGTLDLKSGAAEAERRFALARWIARDENPLTARVIVNRIWQYHFGVGLSSTPSDFGANGARPTHPELLDWLAGELISHRWSIKHIHRLVVQSNTYRQGSAPVASALAADADSRLLWRFPPRRLEAEVIRDSVLQTSGSLDLTMGGPGFSLFEPNENYVRVYNPKEKFGSAEWRRMIYMTKVRMVQDSVFGVFDAPDAGQACPRRTASTTPLQAMSLLNSNFMIEQSALWAKRLAEQAGSVPDAQARQAFDWLFGRTPSDAELAAGVRLIQSHGLASFCRALFNANEFLFLQ